MKNLREAPRYISRIVPTNSSTLASPTLTRTAAGSTGAGRFAGFFLGFHAATAVPFTGSRVELRTAADATQPALQD